MCICIYVCVRMYVCVYVCVYVCMYACVCMYVCAYVCMYVCMCSGTCIQLVRHNEQLNNVSADTLPDCGGDIKMQNKYVLLIPFPLLFFRSLEMPQ